eukprot:Protomagalhaensia_sp_Gyna_25__644@NODE_12_length_8628_cov_38_763069_g8_i0_p2_GENE_NODE_12_length_8628_cov_38_763069_g8_i0NODE_12_length_8628_cov_38_763069_g8_i0_p2_ORF_typecomplete_len522_score78_14Chromo/PF00385_24/4_1e12_NODE_12_length_8628_cov_38_763069_g8_i015393104
METETATLKRISELWSALKSEVWKLPDGLNWIATLDDVENRVKLFGNAVLAARQKQPRPVPREAAAKAPPQKRSQPSIHTVSSSGSGTEPGRLRAAELDRLTAPRPPIRRVPLGASNPPVIPIPSPVLVPAPSPKLAAPPVVSKSAMESGPRTMIPRQCLDPSPPSDCLAIMEAPSSVSRMSAAVQLVESGDEMLSGQTKERVFWREDGTRWVVPASPRKTSVSPYAAASDAPSTLMLPSRFYTFSDPVQEYLRCSLHDACGARRRPPIVPTEYMLNESHQLFALFDFQPEELPPLPITPARPPSPDLAASDTASPLNSRSPTKRIKRSKSASPSSKKRKKSPSKRKLEPKSRRRRIEGSCPYVVGEAATGQRFVLYSESEEEDEVPRRDPVGEDQASMMEDTFQVEAILDMMQDTSDKKFYFLVKWTDYGDEDNTWEPEENLLVGDHELRIDFFKRLHNAKLVASRRVADDPRYQWVEHGGMGREFNDYMKSFVVGEQARLLATSEMFHIQAKRWRRPAP